MPPDNVEADVEVRNRVPHGSASHSGHAEIGIAIRPSGSYYAGHVRTNRRLRSTIVFHTEHAAIDRRSPLRIPAMFIGGVKRPYGREFHIIARGEYASLHPPKPSILPPPQ